MLFLRKPFLTIFVSLLIAVSSSGHAQINGTTSSASENTRNSKEQALDSFLIELSMRDNLSIEILREAFRDVKWQTVARQYMVPSGNAPPRKNWTTYRANVMNAIRLDAGKKFLQEHHQFLDQLEKESGVPSALIVGILGVETVYGRNMGNFPVRDVLATFAFDYPPSPNQASRSAMFKEQLSDHILNCIATVNKSSVDASQLKICLMQEGSFAGAMGMPQFMPTSIRKYAQDGDGNGQIDLRKSPQDAMQSIARFLIGHGWKSGEPIYLPIATDLQNSPIVKDLADGDPIPKRTLGELRSKGVISKWPVGLTEQSPALIVDLPSITKNGGDAVEYLVGLSNFEVITQYNRSFFYAMSVTEFGQAVIQNGYQLPSKNTKQEKPPSTSNGRRDRKQ